ncbi:MAG: site-2 protease family protein [Candidatus Aminicenantes bacterium]|nr:site-2 protease family protein [Candidatus Aminicenantes bacterium]
MNILNAVISIFVVLFAITIHEASHGWAAFKMGDPTAYHQGRVTLNPIAHIDPLGTIILPLILVIMNAPPFGWAKPVPVNPLNLKNPRRDNLIISAAGPASNILVAFCSLLVIQVLKQVDPALFYRPKTSLITGLFLVFYYLTLINVILAAFNLIPIPPLDGSGILLGLISPEAAEKYESLRPYGFLIIMLLLFTGILNRLLGFVVGFINIFVFPR